MGIFSGGGGSGGSQPALKQAFYFAGAPNAPMSVPPNVDTAGTWARVSGGAEDMLNLAAPTSPIVLATGWYTLTGNIVYSDGDLVGKYLKQCSAEADTDDWASGGNAGPFELVKHGSPGVVVRVGFSEFLQAGQKIGWFVLHDAAGALDFYFNSLLVYMPCTGQAIV